MYNTNDYHRFNFPYYLKKEKNLIYISQAHMDSIIA